MCNFFSFVTKGDGLAVYFTDKDRKELLNNNPASYNPDSHTSIVHNYISKSSSEEDKCNKYEYYSGKLIKDQINTTDDYSIVLKWVNEFVKTEEFKELCKLAVKQDGYAIQYLTVEERTPEVCKLAVKQNGYAIHYLTVEELKYLK